MRWKGPGNMKVKKRSAQSGSAQEPKARYNTPLLFVLLILFPLYGGYYNFSLLLAGTVLAVLLLVTCLKSRSLILPTGPEAWFLAGLWLCHLLTFPLAVSSGMAFTGFLRITAWLLFFLCAATYSAADRRVILDALGYEGAVLALAAIVRFLWNTAHGVSDLNGRIDGPFQYANTWALYQLVCLLLLLMKQQRRRLDWGAMAVLVCGVFLSGSRSTYLLLLLAAAVLTVQRLRMGQRKGLLLGGGILLLCLAAAAALSRGMVLDRLRAITLSSSSLNGRLLYDLDGLKMLMRHPLGLGRGGYLYQQPLEQTGIYILRFIHNEYLQFALDAGIPGGLCALGLALSLLLRRGTGARERLILLVISLHALVDFDFQFGAVALLWLLCGSGGRSRTLPLRSRAPAVVCCTLAALSLYASTAYFLDFSGSAGRAYAMLPWDLELAENRLQTYPSAAAAQPLAERILRGTDLSMLAWDCMRTAAVERGDMPAAAEAGYRYLRLNPYRGSAYLDFTALLESARDTAPPDEQSRYSDYAARALARLQEVRAGTSPLAYRIAESPDWSFAEGVTDRLTAFTEKGEREK